MFRRTRITMVFAFMFFVSMAYGTKAPVQLANAASKDIPTATCDGQTADWVGTSGDDYYADIEPGGHVFQGLGGNDILYGLDGDDVMCGGDGDDYLEGNGGNDTLRGGNGVDRTAGGNGADLIYGDSGNDSSLHGGPGNDVIRGSLGDDYINGDDGNDDLIGGRGFDDLYGENGVDEFWDGYEADYADGGADPDLVYLCLDTWEDESWFVNIETWYGESLNFCTV